MSLIQILINHMILWHNRCDAINKASYKMQGPEDVSIGFTAGWHELGNSNNALELEANKIWADGGWGVK